MISPLHALAHLAPEALDHFTEEELALFVYSTEYSLRPEQQIPKGDYRSFGFVTGRGFGKTYTIAHEIHRRVHAGECRAPALIAPTDDRVRDVQVTALINSATPWCPCREYGGGVRWENGVTAEPTTAEIPRPACGSNFDLVWMTEIVRWKQSTRLLAYRDITTACRLGPRPQYLWDTTSSGKNEVIQHLLAQHDADPRAHKLVRGTMFDNPLLSRQYLRDEVRKYGKGTRAYDEEILGLVFTEAAGALWRDEWISNNRAHAIPANPSVVVLGLDPAMSDHTTADEVGISKAYLAQNGHLFLSDLSDKMTPEDYARIVVRECQRDAAGVIVERNHVGNHARDLLRVHAKLSGLRIELLPDPSKPFPARTPGTIFVREVVTHTAKQTRAAPAAALYAAGKVHHIGTLAQLEAEQTTWEPGTRRSPNRLDAAVFAISELGGVTLNPPKDPRRTLDAAERVASRLRRRSPAVY